MSRIDKQDALPLSEHEIARYMAAFQAGLHAIDGDPAEATRIGRLAGKADAQILGETATASADDSQPGQDLATLLAQPHSELEVAGQPPVTSRLRRSLLGQPDAPEHYRSLITAQAELDGQQIRAEAELVRQKAELDAEFIRRKADVDAELDRWAAKGELELQKAEVHAELIRRKADVDAELIHEKAAIDAQHLQPSAELNAPEQGLRAAPPRNWLMSAPVLAFAVLAALTSGLWHGPLPPLVSVILASAAAAFAVSYSAAILVAVLRLVFGPHERGPHPGAATALHLLVGIGNPRRRRVPLE